MLDVLLPGTDGLSICRKLRARGVMVPTVLLTSRDAVDDRIGGLDAGADDYLTMPFAFGELRARLRALLRRPTGVLPTVIGVGDLMIDLTRLEARRGGKLLPFAFSSLAVLALELERRNDQFLVDARRARIPSDTSSPSAAASVTARRVADDFSDGLEPAGCWRE